MNKPYRIVLLLIALITLTTYSPKQSSVFFGKKNFLFEIKNIEVLNSNIINKDEILDKLNHIYGKNILFIKKSDLEDPLKSIYFLEKIEVKKKYPKTITITIYETKPVAILFKNNRKYFLDNKSNLIPFKEKKFFVDFPHIFGKEAESNFVDFFNQLVANNFPKNKIKKYYYFKIGRWDLQLSNGQIIKFPADKMFEAIHQSIDLLQREDFKNYNIIDLRAHGKVVVE